MPEWSERDPQAPRGPPDRSRARGVDRRGDCPSTSTIATKNSSRAAPLPTPPAVPRSASSRARPGGCSQGALPRPARPRTPPPETDGGLSRRSREGLPLRRAAPRLEPAFALVAILSLALGIGANTAIFQLLDAVRLRSLPVARPDELVNVHIGKRKGRTGSFSGHFPDLTSLLFERIRAEQKAFSKLAVWSSDRVNLASGGEVRYAEALWVSGTFFDTVGVAPLRGRLLGPADDLPGCPTPSVVVERAILEARARRPGAFRRGDDRPRGPPVRDRRHHARPVLRNRGRARLRRCPAHVRGRPAHRRPPDEGEVLLVALDDRPPRTGLDAREGQCAPGRDLETGLRVRAARGLRRRGFEGLPRHEAHRLARRYGLLGSARGLFEPPAAAARHLGPRPADRVREHRQPHDRPRERAPARDRRPPRARRLARGASSASCWPRASCSPRREPSPARRSPGL